MRLEALLWQPNLGTLHALRKVVFQPIPGVLLLQNFVENFSEFSAAQRNAGKHVTLMSELSRLVEARTLMTVSVLL